MTDGRGRLTARFDGASSRGTCGMPAAANDERDTCADAGSSNVTPSTHVPVSVAPTPT